MRLKDDTGIGTADLPLTGFREHLRLGTGFGEDGLQAPVLEASLRAAITAIEARTGKVLLERSFTWEVEGWRSPHEQALPVAPVNEISAVTLVSRTGERTPVSIDCLLLRPSLQRPLLVSACSRLPTIAPHGHAEVVFRAGFADIWEGLPSDLAQAVFLLAGHFYEARHDGYGDDGNLPAGVGRLIEPYRTVRILGGSAA